MNLYTGLFNDTTGIAYVLGVGYLSFVLAMKAWHAGNRRLAYVFFGLVGMASSCGPHHMHLGVHFLLNAYRPTIQDTIAITVALPFGAAWLYWQAGTVYGKWSGDFFVSGESDWPILLHTTVVVYIAVLVGSAWKGGIHMSPYPLIQLILLVLYSIIGYILWTGQLQRRREEGYWSGKGLALAMIFPTCAAEHAVYGLAVASGRYVADTHLGGLPMIDLWGIVVALYFVVVVTRERRLSKTVKLNSESSILK